MILGVDFFLSHHLFFQKKERQLYFTFNGGAVFDQRSVSAQSAGKNDDAVQKLSLTSNSVPGDSAAALARQAEASFSRMRYAEALAKWDQVIRLDPNSSDYFALRAATHLALENRVLARADFDQALRLDPSQLFALLMRGKLRLKDGDLPGARADFTTLENKGRDNVNLGLEVATAYEEADQFGLAIAEDDRWINDHPGDARMARALNSKCWTYALWNRNLDEAMNDCNRAAILSNGRSYYLLDSRAMVRLRLGQWKAAISDYNNALAVNPNGPWSLYGRGLAEIRLGDVSSGKADINKAAALDPKLMERTAAIGLAP